MLRNSAHDQLKLNRTVTWHVTIYSLCTWHWREGQGKQNQCHVEVYISKPIGLAVYIYNITFDVTVHSAFGWKFWNYRHINTFRDNPVTAELSCKMVNATKYDTELISSVCKTIYSSDIQHWQLNLYHFQISCNHRKLYMANSLVNNIYI